MKYESMESETRSYRISTQIKNTHGVRLEKLQMEIRTEYDKKAKICEVIELAIELLEKEHKNKTINIHDREQG